MGRSISLVLFICLGVRDVAGSKRKEVADSAFPFIWFLGFTRFSRSVMSVPHLVWDCRVGARVVSERVVVVMSVNNRLGLFVGKNR